MATRVNLTKGSHAQVCCVPNCGKRATYWNYLDQPFCADCADGRPASATERWQDDNYRVVDNTPQNVTPDDVLELRILVRGRLEKLETKLIEMGIRSSDLDADSRVPTWLRDQYKQYTELHRKLVNSPWGLVSLPWGE